MNERNKNYIRGGKEKNMNSAVKINNNIDFSKARKNPFAKIAEASSKNNGELSPSVSRQMMKEAIEELKKV